MNQGRRQKQKTRARKFKKHQNQFSESKAAAVTTQHHLKSANWMSTTSIYASDQTALAELPRFCGRSSKRWTINFKSYIYCSEERILYAMEINRAKSTNQRKTVKFMKSWGWCEEERAKDGPPLVYLIPSVIINLI